MAVRKASEKKLYLSSVFYLGENIVDINIYTYICVCTYTHTYIY